MATSSSQHGEREIGTKGYHGGGIPRTNRLEERKSSFGKEKCLFFYNCATVNDWYFIFAFGSVIVCGYFISTKHWKYNSFSPVFPLTESKTKGFCRLFFWKFKKKHQPFSMAQPLKIPFPQATKLFHNNWLIFFLLKRQRNSQQIPQDGALHPQNRGKTAFSLYYGDEAIITMTKPFWKGSVIYRYGCFISTVRWKIQPFSSFPLGGIHG